MNWDDWILKLKKHFPIKRKLVVRVIEMKDHGATTINDSETQITICIKKGSANQIETLAHEWAHAMEYDRDGNHSKLWGRFYSQTFSLMVQ